VSEVGQSARDARRRDQVPGQDEQRQRKQAEEVQPFEQGDADIGQGEINHDRHTHNPEADHQKDRDANQEEGNDAG
jgi:hypothetical protein